MSEYPGKEHATFFRHLADGINNAVSREKYFAEHDTSDSGKKRWAEWQTDTEPAFRGAAIVTFVANIEHLVGKRPDKSWDLPDNWYGKKEFKHLRIVRHCWAHAAGRVLANRKSELETFIQDLKNGSYKDREGKVVPQYVSIVDDKVIVSGLERARVLCTELLAEKGLVEKWWQP